VAPGGHEGLARRYLEPMGALRRLVAGGTCPPPSEFAAAAYGCWFCMRDLQGF